MQDTYTEKAYPKNIKHKIVVLECKFSFLLFFKMFTLMTYGH